MYRHQLFELEDRSSVTAMFSSYVKSQQLDEDLNIYQGTSQQKGYFILRKQYDDRMR